MRMILRVTIGTILMITAILKLHMVATDPFADLKIGYPFTVIWLAILFEVMIASVNFLVKEFVLVWLSDFSFFVVLLVLSVSRWTVGYSDCGCFGSYEMPIWVAVFLDGIVLGCLCCFLRSMAFVSNIATNIRKLSTLVTENASAVSGAAIAIGLLLAGCLYCELSTNDFTRWNQSTAIEHKRVNISNLRTGVAQEVGVEILNHSRSKIKVVGNASSCECVLAGAEIVVFPPETIAIAQFIVRPKKSGFWHQRFVYFLDCPQQDRLFVDLFGFVSKE